MPPAPACSDKPDRGAARLLDDDHDATRTYASPHIQPCIVQACHFKVFCHLAVSHTRFMLKRWRFAGGWTFTSGNVGGPVASLSTRRKGFSVDGALAHCRPYYTIRPQFHGERRLLRRPSDSTKGELLFLPIHGLVQPTHINVTQFRSGFTAEGSANIMANQQFPP